MGREEFSSLDLWSLNPLVRNLSLAEEPKGRREEENSEEEEKASSGGGHGRDAGQLLHPAGSPRRWTHDFPAAAGHPIPASVSGTGPPRGPSPCFAPPPQSRGEHPHCTGRKPEAQ